MDHSQGVPSTLTVGGHPIHPMLIPFPIAFLIGACVTDLAYRRTRNPFWARASYWLTAAGLVTGLVAAVFGAVDFLTIPRARQHVDGWIHLIGNAAVLGLAGGSLWVRHRQPEGRVSPAALALSTVNAALLGLTGWFGGELSYRHMIGVTGHGAAAARGEHHHEAQGTPEGMHAGHENLTSPEAGGTAGHAAAPVGTLRDTRLHSEAALQKLDGVSAALRELELGRNRPAALARAKQSLQETRAHIGQTLSLVRTSGDAQARETQPHPRDHHGPARAQDPAAGGRGKPGDAAHSHGGNSLHERHATGQRPGKKAHPGHSAVAQRAATHREHAGGSPSRPTRHGGHGAARQPGPAGHTAHGGGESGMDRPNGGRSTGHGVHPRNPGGAQSGRLPEAMPDGMRAHPSREDGPPAVTPENQVLPSLRGTPGFRPGRAARRSVNNLRACSRFHLHARRTFAATSQGYNRLADPPTA